MSRLANKAARKLPQGGGLRKLAWPPMVGPMKAQKPPQSSAKPPTQPSNGPGNREARLAEALRANLQRRKAQARERAGEAAVAALGIPPERDLR
jgi:hypothetical protein